MTTWSNRAERDLLRVFGVPEDTTDATDTKILDIINSQMKLEPPIVIEDLEVTHRLGKPPPTHDESEASLEQRSSDKPKVRPIIVKFPSRCVNSRVMENRKNLKDNPYKDAKGREYPVLIWHNVWRE